jgi:hypothetical protein
LVTPVTATLVMAANAGIAPATSKRVSVVNPHLNGRREIAPRLPFLVNMQGRVIFFA